ncbi:MAG TPA: redoxin domain-containing protein [Polyangiaceae bacterium]|nr:redoxin domain-containing protein [Polyangiaceae bacterium]
MRSLLRVVGFGLLLSACSGASGAGAGAPASAPIAPTATVEPVATAPTPATSALADPGKAPPGWLGVELAKREGGEPGVLVRGVLRGSPAERAGLADGDVVLSVEGVNVSRPTELRDQVVRARAGSRVSLGVLRGAETRLFAVLLEAAPNDDEMMRKNYVGSRAPDFGSLSTVQGSVTPSLPGLKGRVVVLEFWASWCGVCQVMAPTLNGWHDRYSAQGVTVLGVTSDPVDVASRTAGELGMGYPLASDGTGQMLRAYRAYALPTLFVIDKQGNVRDVLIGYSTPRLREIEALVRKLIAEG